MAVVKTSRLNHSGGMYLPCTNTALRRAARRLGGLYDEALAPLGLKATQMGLMAQIAQGAGGQGPSLQDLANGLCIQLSAVTHALRPLTREGLVELIPDGKDRRVKRAALTEAGRERLTKAVEAWDGANRRVDRVLGAESAAALRALADTVSSPAFLDAYGQGLRLEDMVSKGEDSAGSRDRGREHQMEGQL